MEPNAPFLAAGIVLVAGWMAGTLILLVLIYQRIPTEPVWVRDLDAQDDDDEEDDSADHWKRGRGRHE